nr:MAG TPA: hypothetical protein [Caudoviricetes sp.]
MTTPNSYLILLYSQVQHLSTMRFFFSNSLLTQTVLYGNI